jgi:hypothetical protein
MRDISAMYHGKCWTVAGGGASMDPKPVPKVVFGRRRATGVAK